MNKGNIRYQRVTNGNIRYIQIHIQKVTSPDMIQNHFQTRRKDHFDQ